MRPHHALTGSGRYVDDVDVPGQLHLAVVRSDVAHGRIVSIDTSRALALPGVVRAIVPADLAAVRPIPTRLPPPPEVAAWLQPVLPADRVRYVGQPVAAIVAEDAALAEDAAELVRVEIEPLAVLTPTEPGWPEDADRLFALHAEDGPVDELFAAAAHVVREEFRIGRRTGSPIETRGMVAAWRPEDGVLETWGPTKMLWFTRKVLAAALALPEERVLCHRVDVGGMFGTRGEVYPEDVIVAWAAKAVGRPVKWVEDRREHLLAINQAAEEVHRFELAVGDDGTLMAFRDEVTFEMGAFARPIGVRIAHMVAENLPGPYRWQAVSAHVDLRLSHRTPVGTARAPTRVGSNFVRERAIDLAAQRLGIDPIELRRRNLLRADELPFERRVSDHETLLYEGGDYPAMADDLLARAGAEQLEAEVAARRADGELVGMGVATFLEGSAPGVGSEEGAAVALEPTGRFRVLTSATEVGQGLDEALRAIAAARLGVDVAAVDVDSGSSLVPELGLGTFGSRSTICAGAAVDAACAKLLTQLRAAAAARLGADPELVELDADGGRTGADRVPWAALGPLRATARWRSDGVTFGFGMHLVVARVDRATGIPTLERVVVGFDTGRAIRPAAVEGQLVGGTVQGLGAALLERIEFGPGGQPQTTSFLEYRLPTCADVPRVEAIVWQSEGIAANPLGVRGPGEAGTAGVAAAVANAVAAALDGASVRALPLTPADLLDHLAAGTPVPLAAP